MSCCRTYPPSREVEVEGCFASSHGGTECGTCVLRGLEGQEFCPRSGAYTGPRTVSTTLPPSNGERERALWGGA